MTTMLGRPGMMIIDFQWRAASKYWVLWSCELMPGGRVWGVWGLVSV